MATPNSFDLNHALHRWLAQLAQSPQVRATDLSELETHVRDSVLQLHGKGLSAEESFWVATHRVGSPAQLEPEFAKVNRKPWHLMIHGLILVLFGICCWFLWGMLHLPEMMQGLLAKAGAVNQVTGYGALPGFTQFLVTLRDYLVIPPALALAYCVYVWFGKSTVKNSWMGFFAVTLSTLVFLTLPIIIAIVLPVIAFMNLMPK
ncbi:MAG TPA: hypothetical protein VL527_15270 [Dongiaceae bacterium]|jgi:hypothetical protein|nr:hypothetical protein [Dongiaceae bacterium]